MVGVGCVLVAESNSASKGVIQPVATSVAIFLWRSSSKRSTVTAPCAVFRGRIQIFKEAVLFLKGCLHDHCRQIEFRSIQRS